MNPRPSPATGTACGASRLPAPLASEVIRLQPRTLLTGLAARRGRRLRVLPAVWPGEAAGASASRSLRGMPRKKEPIFVRSKKRSRGLANFAGRKRSVKKQKQRGDLDFIICLVK